MTASATRIPRCSKSSTPGTRPLLDEAAAIGARYHTGGLLIVETLAAGLAYGHQLWFGSPRNIGDRLATTAADLGISIHLAGTT